MCSSDRVIITFARQLGAVSNGASRHNLSSFQPCWWLETLSTEADVRMGRVPSINLMLDSHSLIYQRRLEAIRRVQAVQWRKWFGQDVPECFEGHSGSDERCNTWPSWSNATWIDMWNIRGQMHGLWPPHN